MFFIQDGKVQPNGLEANGVLAAQRAGLMSANGQAQVQIQQQQQLPYSAGMQKGYGRYIDPAQQMQQQQQQDMRHEAQERQQQQQQDDGTPDDYFISELYAQLSQVIAGKPTDVEPLRSGMSIKKKTLFF